MRPINPAALFCASLSEWQSYPRALLHMHPQSVRASNDASYQVGVVQACKGAYEPQLHPFLLRPYAHWRLRPCCPSTWFSFELQCRYFPTYTLGAMYACQIYEVRSLDLFFSVVVWSAVALLLLQINLQSALPEHPTHWSAVLMRDEAKASHALAANAGFSKMMLCPAYASLHALCSNRCASKSARDSSSSILSKILMLFRSSGF